MYFVKTPWWLKKLYNNYIWSINTDEKCIYLTFDDGPHPTATNFVLNTLKKYNAKATFFCIGKNVELNKDIYSQILIDGHTVGNHTHNHLNGWKSSDSIYTENIKQASAIIDSNLFRPPYGKITSFQANILIKANYKIIMWDILSGDFDIKLSKEKCLKNVISYTKNGSIIVFHDSEKAFDKLEYTLPKMLDFFSKKGYVFKSLLPNVL